MSLSRPPLVEKRETQRSYRQRLDSEYAWIQSRSGEIKARVLDITPRGIGLLLEGASARLPLALEKGESVTIRIMSGGQEVTVHSRLVTKSETLLERNALRLGFRLEGDEEALLQNEEGPSSRTQEARPYRFALKNASYLECESEDPSRPRQMAFYKIRDVSLKGALLETSARNKFLLPNLRLILSISIPGHGKFLEAAEIKRVAVAQDRYLVGVEFQKLGLDTIRALSDFCVNFAKDVSYQIMLEEGFSPELIEQSLTVQTSSSQQDFLQIMEIRLRAAHERGERLDITDPWQLLSAEDSDASLISVKLGKRVVSSARLRELGDSVLSIEEFARDKDFTKAMNTKKIETLLWRGLVEGALESGKFELYFLDHEESITILKDLGSTFTPEGHALSLLALKEGRGVRFKTWSRIVAPVLRPLVRDRKLTITRKARLKLFLSKLVGDEKLS